MLRLGMRNEAVLMKLPPSHKLDFLRLEETLLSVMCCFLSIPDISYADRVLHVPIAHYKKVQSSYCQ